MQWIGKINWTGTRKQNYREKRKFKKYMYAIIDISIRPNSVYMCLCKCECAYFCKLIDLYGSSVAPKNSNKYWKCWTNIVAPSLRRFSFLHFFFRHVLLSKKCPDCDFCRCIVRRHSPSRRVDRSTWIRVRVVSPTDLRVAGSLVG